MAKMPPRSDAPRSSDHQGYRQCPNRSRLCGSSIASVVGRLADHQPCDFVVMAGAADTPLVNPQEHAPSHLAGRVPPGVWRRVSKGGVSSFIIGRRGLHYTSGDGTPGRRSGRREAALPKSTDPAHPCSAARPDHRRDADNADRDADYCGDPAEGRGVRAVKEVRAAEQPPAVGRRPAL